MNNYYTKLLIPIKKNPNALTNDSLRLFKFNDLPILLPINKPNSNKIYDTIKQVNVVLNIGNPAIPAAIPPATSLRDRANPNKYISNQLVSL